MSPRHPDREYLFEAHQHLCRRAARRFKREGIERNDLEQVASLALLQACDRYRPDSAATFETSAWLIIIAGLTRYLRTHAAHVRLPRGMHRLEGRYAQTEEQLWGKLGREPRREEVRRELALSTRAARSFEQARCLRNFAQVGTMDYDPHRATEHPPIFAAPGDVEQIELHSALQMLPRVQRLVLIGIHACGFHKTELAVRLGYSERHIARLEKRALASLQVSMA